MSKHMVILVALALIAGTGDGSTAGGDKADKPANKEKSPVPPKPKIRSIQAKSGQVLFDVRLVPGVPDPREVVEVELEVAETPPVPDPIYGERIPIKAAELVAEVTDADGAGYTVAYRVHALQDAGTYGFHFTPLRKDNYQVRLKGVHKHKRLDTDFRVPVGIWPFKEVDAEGNVNIVKPGQASSRLPAVPTGMKGPAVPGAAAPTAAASARNMPGRPPSPLEESMQTLGGLWADAGTALLAGRRPDLAEAKAVAARMVKAVQQAAGRKPDDAEYTGLMDQLREAVEALQAAAAAGKTAKAVDAFREIGARHCNRCHFKMRWGMLEDLNMFPAGLP